MFVFWGPLWHGGSLWVTDLANEIHAYYAFKKTSTEDALMPTPDTPILGPHARPNMHIPRRFDLLSLVLLLYAALAKCNFALAWERKLHLRVGGQKIIATNDQRPGRRRAEDREVENELNSTEALRQSASTQSTFSTASRMMDAN